MPFFGPLHYLTELGWLNKKDYFIIAKKDSRYFTAFALIYTLSVFVLSLPQLDISKDWFMNLDREGDLFNFFIGSKDLFKFVTFSAFASAFIFMFVRASFYRFLLVIFAVIVGIKLTTVFTTGMLYFGLFVPTIIHVGLFTLLFMFYGAKKSNSKWGYISCALLVALFALCTLLPESVQAISGKVSDHIMAVYKSSSFDFLNKRIGYILGIFPQENELDILSSGGKKIQILIAFAYTYHYLNWFVKTEIIKWHEVPKSRLIGIAIIWVLSILLYLYDYQIGLLALLFLSMLHVFSEFPLNIVTIRSLLKGKS